VVPLRCSSNSCRLGARISVIPLSAVTMPTKMSYLAEPRCGPRTGITICHCVESYSCLERPRKFPHGSVCAPLAILWAYPVGTPLLRPDISYHERHSILFQIHLSRSLLFTPRATRNLLSNRIAFVGQGLEPLPVELFSHTGALARGIPVKWGIVPESCGILVQQQRARGKRTEWSRLLR
jgi:hypothetical protein